MRQVGSHNEELFETMKPKRNIRLNIKAFILLAALALSSALAPNALAGKAQKWKDLPESVRGTILANGGKANGQVDKESEKIDGQVVYEAVGKDKDRASSRMSEYSLIVFMMIGLADRLKLLIRAMNGFGYACCTADCRRN